MPPIRKSGATLSEHSSPQQLYSAAIEIPAPMPNPINPPLIARFCALCEMLSIILMLLSGIGGASFRHRTRLVGVAFEIRYLVRAPSVVVIQTSLPSRSSKNLAPPKAAGGITALEDVPD